MKQYKTYRELIERKYALFTIFNTIKSILGGVLLIVLLATFIGCATYIDLGMGAICTCCSVFIIVKIWRN